MRKSTTYNIIYFAFAAVVVAQCVLITLRLVDILTHLAVIQPSGPYLFYLIGTVIFQCVVNAVLLLVFRSNTWLQRRITMLVSNILLIYQALIILVLVTAVVLLSV